MARPRYRAAQTHGTIFGIDFLAVAIFFLVLKENLIFVKVKANQCQRASVSRTESDREMHVLFFYFMVDDGFMKI